MQVLETTHHVGRISVSTPSNMPYKEMALHCENLLAGKQQKISTFMGAHSLLANSFKIPLPDYNQEKDESTNSNVPPSLPLVLLYFLYFQNSEQVFLLALRYLIPDSSAILVAEWKSILGFKLRRSVTQHIAWDWSNALRHSLSAPGRLLSTASIASIW